MLVAAKTNIKKNFLKMKETIIYQVIVCYKCLPLLFVRYCLYFKENLFILLKLKCLMYFCF